MYKVKIFQGFRVEKKINEWLEENKGIEITNIAQSAFPMNLDICQMVTVFYKELPSLRYMKKGEEK